MSEKPGGGGLYKSYIPTNLDDKLKENRPNNGEKQTGWRLGHTVAEVEAILKKEREQKNRF
ncbi:MAG: hypothetical protein PHV23_00330 [Candidatus Gracilibacteria bacterium]|nr:hypothetical protein [Candidatus Gracilibacteria bacterium]